MARSSFEIKNLTIERNGAQGMGIARHEQKVVFVEYGVAGDLVDVTVYARKKKHDEARIDQIIQPGPERVQPYCEHFGTCGGCKWQHLSYEGQLAAKQEEVVNAFTRLHKVDPGEILPIKGCAVTAGYRNKLEFTFSRRGWSTEKPVKGEPLKDNPALGFHIPGRFDKVLNLNICYHMPPLANEIRSAVGKKALEMNLPFYDQVSKEGFLRNLLIRCTSSGEWMVILVVAREEKEWINEIMEDLKTRFPEINSLLYVINPKVNDIIHDLEILTYHGKDHMIENWDGLLFKIRPKSFFQPNLYQAKELYKVARDFAALKPTDTVYDLYTGTGSIANFIAGYCRKVVGIEYVEDAITDARINSELNGFTNTHFLAGDMKDLFTEDLIKTHGTPDVIITDPPRAGMHEDVVKRILNSGANRIVYVSCNPSTQARDIALMQQQYRVVKIQPVDMFPQTYHVENVALLERI